MSTTELIITKERVLEAAQKNQNAKEVLCSLFPEVFDNSEYDTFIELLGNAINDPRMPTCFYDALEGEYSKNKAENIYKKLVKPNL